MSELKPCPFCGGEGQTEVARSIVEGHPEARKHPGDTVTTLAPQVRDFWVQCPACQSEGPIAGGEAEAIAAWNRRAEPEWVGVEDGLPEEQRLVLFHFRYRQGYVVLAGYWNSARKHWESWGSEAIFRKVTHWQPLPPPPEPGEPQEGE